MYEEQIIADDVSQAAKRTIMSHRDDNEPNRNYLVPFGKMSQKVRRLDENEVHDSSQTIEDRLWLSQDLFETQTTQFSQPEEKLIQISPKPITEHAINFQKESRTSTHLEQTFKFDTVISDERYAISGYKAVKVHRGKELASVTESINTQEHLPHPNKLFRRKRRNSCQKGIPPNSLGEVPNKNKPYHSVAHHLRQLRLKQSKMDSSSSELSNVPTSGINVHDVPVTMPEQQIKTHDSNNLSDWESIESWIHKRWKSRTITCNHQEEE